MATKTISIDLEAYRRLKNVQKENESFSQAIKRLVPERVDYNQWLKAISAIPIDEKLVTELDRVVQSRR